MAGSRKKVVEPKKEVPVKAKKAVAKKKNPSTATTTNPSASAVSSSLGDHNKKVVTIEACKQWNAFKTRANAIAKAVGDKAIVEINKEKVRAASIGRPSYHCFRVRVEMCVCRQRYFLSLYLTVILVWAKFLIAWQGKLCSQGRW